MPTLTNATPAQPLKSRATTRPPRRLKQGELTHDTPLELRLPDNESEPSSRGHEPISASQGPSARLRHAAPPAAPKADRARPGKAAQRSHPVGAPQP